jgi:hypothetical protein
MNLMVRVSRRAAAVAVRVAAVLGTIAGDVAVPTLLHRVFTPAQREGAAPPEAEAAEAKPIRRAFELTCSADCCGQLPYAASSRMRLTLRRSMLSSRAMARWL